MHCVKTCEPCIQTYTKYPIGPTKVKYVNSRDRKSGAAVSISLRSTLAVASKRSTQARPCHRDSIEGSVTAGGSADDGWHSPASSARKNQISQVSLDDAQVQGRGEEAGAKHYSCHSMRLIPILTVWDPGSAAIPARTLTAALTLLEYREHSACSHNPRESGVRGAVPLLNSFGDFRSAFPIVADSLCMRGS